MQNFGISNALVSNFVLSHQYTLYERKSNEKTPKHMKMAILILPENSCNTDVYQSNKIEY